MKANAWPWARHHATWPEAQALIAASPLPGDILVGRHARRPVFAATITRCVPMTVQQAEGLTPLEAVRTALERAAEATAAGAAA